MATPFLGEIRLAAFNFAPTGWLLAQGQTLSVSQYSALFALFGNAYGGDGVTTFKVPDLRGRAGIGTGQGTGMSNYTLGQTGGEATHLLTVAEIPSHTHTLGVVNALANTSNPQGAHLATAPYALGYSAHSSADGTMPTGVVQSSGSGQAHSNVMPSLCLNYMISLTGSAPTFIG